MTTELVTPVDEKQKTRYDSSCRSREMAENFLAGEDSDYETGLGLPARTPD
jgi:hypothetical protein